MKKNVWICFLMVFILVLVPVSLFSQEEGEEEEEEGEPIQARPDPRTWEALKKMEALKTIHIKAVQKGKVLEFDLTKIKEALVKAKINENVTVEYIASNGLVYNLGTYVPSFRRIKRSSPINKRLINPQPEPPRFHNIPILKQVKKSAAIKQTARALKGKALLVFKDIKGQIKAAIEQETLQKVKSIPILNKSIKQK